MPFLFLYAYGDRFILVIAPKPFVKVSADSNGRNRRNPQTCFAVIFTVIMYIKAADAFTEREERRAKNRRDFPFTEGETRLLSAASGAKSVWHKYFFPPRGKLRDFGKCFFKMSEIDSSVCYTVTENRQKALRRDNARRTARPRPCSCRQSLKINLLRGEV